VWSNISGGVYNYDSIATLRPKTSLCVGCCCTATLKINRSVSLLVAGQQPLMYYVNVTLSRVALRQNIGIEDIATVLQRSKDISLSIKLMPALEEDGMDIS